MNKKRKTSRHGGQRPLIPIVFGTAFFLIAVVFSVTGLAKHSPAPSQNVDALLPSETPAETPATTADPAVTASPSDLIPTPPVPTTATPTAPVTSPVPASNINFEVKTMKQEDIYQGKLILINSEHHYRFYDFENFVTLFDYQTYSYKVSDYDLLFAESAIPALNDMLDDFYYYTGLDAVMAISGHRTYDFQQYLLDKEIALVGAEEAAKWVAQPGASEHHSGLAIDFGVLYDSGEYYEYDGSGVFPWINENCHKYGFIVRYNPDKQHITGIAHEPWHFRYLGVPHATKVTELGLCLEEYIDYLRDYSYDKPLTIETDSGEVYKTYFCKGLNVYTPKNVDYEISGNNIDGFIITYKVS